MTARVALVTCAAHADLDPDDRPLVADLAAQGITATTAVWDDPTVAWDAFDLAVLRSSWDYTDHVDAFEAWARSVPRLANPAEVVAWNIDKRYLGDLTAAGVPVVPTTYVAPGHVLGPLSEGEVVVKPTVSAGSRDTLRLTDRAAIDQHIAHVHASGRTAMVQPYLPTVDDVGETACVFLGGRYSHAARKGPLLPLGRSLVEGLYAPEDMSVREATVDELEVAHAALAAVPGGSELLYARVDLLLDPHGRPVVLELELVEPSLFLAIGDAHQRFADAIAARVGQPAAGEPA
ncbi:MAG: ATP-grasp domain-containing protein [Acidimicrobiales bacterium]